MTLTLVTPPAEQPFTLAEAKDHLRVEPDQVIDDAYIESLIAAVTKAVEHWTNRQLLSATWDWTFDFFASRGAILLVPKSPLVSVTSITYLDTAGDSQTVASADYQVSAGEPGRIMPGPSDTWPSTEAGRLDAVTVRFVGGYATRNDVPDDLKHAMLIWLAHLYVAREPVSYAQAPLEIPYTMRAIVQGYKVYREVG